MGLEGNSGNELQSTGTGVEYMDSIQKPVFLSLIGLVINESL